MELKDLLLKSNVNDVADLLCKDYSVGKFGDVENNDKNWGTGLYGGETREQAFERRKQIYGEAGPEAFDEVIKRSGNERKPPTDKEIKEAYDLNQEITVQDALDGKTRTMSPVPKGFLQRFRAWMERE